jgi:serine/threonine-protein kinase
MLAGGIAALVGAVIAVVALGGGDEGRQVARVKTRTQTVTTKAKPAAPAPLTGAALGASLNDQGKGLIDAAQYDQAIPVLQRAVDAFPDGTTDISYAYALFNLGNALRLAGRPEEAIPILEQRLQIPNQQGAVANELAQAQQAAGETSSGGVGPSEGNGSSGGVKPGKGPKSDGGGEAVD